VHKLAREDVTETSYLCGMHFLPEMFLQTTADGRKCLKTDAVPTGIVTFYGNIITSDSIFEPQMVLDRNKRCVLC